jgi:LysR family transcriptional regulator, hydrogen peroxide-inducible genes activator
MRFAPHPITLRQLQYVVAVADARSFRKAAELCRVSQPSLSAQLAQLEEALGARLFERERRPVLPTPAGAEVVERARKLLVDTDDLIEAGRRLQDPLAGTLRIGVIPTISPYLLPLVVPALRRAHPSLTVLWIEEKTEVLIGRLGAGELDAALLGTDTPADHLEQELIARDPFVLATPPRHPLGRPRTPVKMSELTGATVLLLDEGHCFRDQALSFCSRARAHEASFRATSLSTLTQMVAGGTGVTLLPRLALGTEARRGVVAVRPFAAPAPSRPINLTWRAQSPLGPALRRLAVSIREATEEAETRLEKIAAASE